MSTKHFRHSDPQIAKLIAKETARQEAGLELIASENIVSASVREALGSTLTNKYSEGYPGRRYYAGNEVIDEIETLAIERAKRLFGADHANVQPHSGSSANLAAYMALAKPGATILAMDLAHGGHLTHGSSVNFSGKLYRFVQYGVDRATSLIDYDRVLAIAEAERPSIIVAGATSYPRAIDFAKFRAIADAVGAKLIVDMAHISGLVAGGVHASPIPHADIVTTTTHKTLRGPRGAIILCRAEHARAVDSAVFPGMQGGPLDHVVAAKAVCFKEASTPGFKRYAAQVVKNAKALAATLVAEGIALVSGGTDNHLILIDGTPLGVSGKEVEALLSAIGLSTNKNLIPYDTRTPFDPSGLRIGTAAVTTRGMKEREMHILGAVIATTLKTRTDRAKTAVRELARRFPITSTL